MAGFGASPIMPTDRSSANNETCALVSPLSAALTIVRITAVKLGERTGPITFPDCNPLVQRLFDDRAHIALPLWPALGVAAIGRA